MRAALIDKIKELLSQKSRQPIFVIIDGPAGAGKTTLANEIVSQLDTGEVIHCDDLYNGWDDALTPTLERHFNEWILEPLRQGAMPRYQKYDWHANAYRERVQLPDSRLVILEGVGAALPQVTDRADLAIWIDISPELGLERVLHRDGNEIHQQMLRWIEEQQAFFALHHSRENCTIHLTYGAPTHG